MKVQHHMRQIKTPARIQRLQVGEKAYPPLAKHGHHICYVPAMIPVALDDLASAIPGEGQSSTGH